MLNLQPIQPVIKNFHETLEVHSIFHTIQGEGPFVGTPAVFIRLAGCNLQCPGCDTDYTTDTRVNTVEEILSRAEEAANGYPTQLLVITGGEPFRQNIQALVLKALDLDWIVQIETNGTLWQDLPYNDVTVICSPKTGSVHPKLQPVITAYKYIIDADAIGTDGRPLTALQNSVKEKSVAWPERAAYQRVYMQPFDAKDEKENKRHTAATIKSCYHTGSIYSHQLHKLLGLE